MGWRIPCVVSTEDALSRVLSSCATRAEQRHTVYDDLIEHKNRTAGVLGLFQPSAEHIPAILFSAQVDIVHEGGLGGSLKLPQPTVFTDAIAIERDCHNPALPSLLFHYSLYLIYLQHSRTRVPAIVFIVPLRIQTPRSDVSALIMRTRHMSMSCAFISSLPEFNVDPTIACLFYPCFLPDPHAYHTCRHRPSMSRVCLAPLGPDHTAGTGSKSTRIQGSISHHNVAGPGPGFRHLPPP
jgi:hypothetical protein